MTRHLITSAIPYINGIKHLGNLIGSQLPADLFARYQRGRGNEVMFICATDEHGTPAELAAKKAGKPVAEYCADMHAVQAGIARDFGLSFDHFGRSSSTRNRQLTQHFAARLAENGWIGFTDKYWMTTLAPAPGSAFTAVVKYAPGADIFQTEARMPMQTVAPGATASSSSYLFAGAKVWETIRGYQENPGIDRFVDSIDWGWFYFLTKPIFRLLHWLHGFIGNMGWSIIALTFILKALVFPLARKSYVSMARMRELQPEMEAIKERTGDDRMKYQQEVMALYRNAKVNPAAGCLPLLLQIPIFFALYKVIFVTLELRHAPWVGWIRDLSAPDPSSLLNLFGLFPWDAPAQGTMLHSLSLPLLAIVLGITMWLQQKLNPAPADPAQKMIFAWMPWIFMFMLGGFASGLVLYWITNNLITIVQQYTIMSMHGHPPQLFGNIRDSVRLGRK